MYILSKNTSRICFVLMFIGLVALVYGFLTDAHRTWPALLVNNYYFLAIGAFCGGILGARLSLEIKERKLKILVTIVLLAAAVKLIIDSMGVLF